MGTRDELPPGWSRAVTSIADWTRSVSVEDAFADLGEFRGDVDGSLKVMKVLAMLMNGKGTYEEARASLKLLKSLQDLESSLDDVAKLTAGDGGEHGSMVFAEAEEAYVAVRDASADLASLPNFLAERLDTVRETR